MRDRTFGLLGAALSLIGLGASIYLTVAHYRSPKLLACPDTGIVNCAKVTTSSYSSQLGVPLAVLGVGYFVVMLGLHLLRSQRSVMVARLAVATSGVVVALWLIYVELFRLDAICLYCTLVHAVTILLFGVTALGLALGGVGLDGDAEGAGGG